MFRGALGAMQRPCAQAFIARCTSVSFIQACSGKPLIKDILELSKTMRFFKDNAGLTWKFAALGTFANMRHGVYFDASFASRADLSSQGGYLSLVIPSSFLDSTRPMPLSVLD